MLAGGWGEATEGDCEVVSSLAKTPYEEVNRTLVRWANEADPPVRQVGGAWLVASKEDAWQLLSKYLTLDDLRRFEEVALDVLGAPHPRYDKPKGERHVADFLRQGVRHSGVLRENLADTLALMGSRGDVLPSAAGTTAADWAVRIVRQLLERANADWRVWASLSHVLPLLAEAAPEPFLQAVEDGLTGDQPVMKLFEEEDNGLFGHSPHTGLLWALETLAWSPEHLARAALMLARLASVDPGGRLTNRPQNSLRHIFLLWLPQTAAGLEQRLTVIDMIRGREPDVAWRLVKHLLPEDHGVGHYTATPRRREWAINPSRRVPQAEHAKGVTEVVRRALDDAGENGDRWGELIWALPELEDDLYEQVVGRLAAIDARSLRPEDRAKVWNTLRRFVSKHRSFHAADWALPAERVDRLAEVNERFEPTEAAARYSWLFDHSPDLPEGLDGDDWNARQKAIEDERVRAVVAVHERAGVDGLLDLARKVVLPGQLGFSVGESGLVEDVEDKLLRENLAVEDSATALFARGFVAGRVKSRNQSWAVAKLADTEQSWSPAQRAEIFLHLPLHPSIWEVIERFGPETERHYWRAVGPYSLGEADLDIAVRKLLEYDKPYAAVEALAFRMRPNKLPPAPLMAEVLERIRKPSPDDDQPSSSAAYEISRLLSAVAASGEVEESRVASLEWTFLSLLDRHDRGPKVLRRELARNPEFFAEVVGFVFRAEGEKAKEPSPEEQSRGTQAYRLLQSWRTVPGAGPGGEMDVDGLREWVRQARALLAESGRGQIGDEMIGHMLSGAPYAEGGTWPHPAVCEVIETAASSDLERGIEIGRYNSRGVVMKNPAEGGTREREMAEQYNAYADTVKDRWPRVASMLRRIADMYVADARREDHDVALRDELER